MKKHSLPLVIAGTALIMLYVWVFSENLSQYKTSNRKPLDKGSVAPRFTLPSSDQKLVSSSHLFAGNKTILFFFSPDCQRCRDKSPYWFELFSRYKTQESLNMVGICNCISNDLHGFWEETKTNFEVLFDREGVNELYRVTYEPTVFLIDEKGLVIFASYEFPHDEGLKVVETILNQAN